MAAVYASQTTMVNNPLVLLFSVEFSSSKWQYDDVIISLYFSNLESKDLKGVFFSREQRIFVGPIMSLKNRRNTNYTFKLPRQKDVF